MECLGKLIYKKVTCVNVVDLYTILPTTTVCSVFRWLLHLSNELYLCVSQSNNFLSLLLTHLALPWGAVSNSNICCTWSILPCMVPSNIQATSKLSTSLASTLSSLKYKKKLVKQSAYNTFLTIIWIAKSLTGLTQSHWQICCRGCHKVVTMLWQPWQSALGVAMSTLYQE